MNQVPYNRRRMRAYAKLFRNCVALANDCRDYWPKRADQWLIKAGLHVAAAIRERDASNPCAP
jgi:hypothetical protein